MSLDSILAAFRQRTLQVDCVEMSLVQNKKGGGAISYKGKGYIRQSDDDILTLKLYSSEVLNTDKAAYFNGFNDVTSGEVYGDESYYTLTARADDGSAWGAERVLPQCGWLAGRNNPIVHGELTSCTRGEHSKDSS
jgi:hypothetical protein